MNWNWAAFLRGLQRAAQDLKANRPLPPPAPLTGADIAAALTKAQPYIAEFIAVMAKHPGAVTAIDDVLEPLRRAGVPWVGTLETALTQLPGGLVTLESYIPTIGWMVTAFSPAVDTSKPIGIV